MKPCEAPAKRAVGTRGGFTLVLVAGGLIALLGFVGLSIDLGRIYAVQQDLQAVADAAAMDGAWLLVGLDTSKVESLIQKDLAPHGARLAKLESMEHPPLVRVTVEKDVPLTFMRVLPGLPSSVPVRATSTASTSPKRFDIVLVIDDSRMIKSERRVIKQALDEFMRGMFRMNTTADPDRVRIGIVPVAGKVRLLNHLPPNDPKHDTGWKLSWPKEATADRWEAFKDLYRAGGPDAPFDVLPTGTRDIVLDPADPSHTTVTLENRKIDRWDLFLAQGCRCYTPYNVDQLYYNFWSNQPMDSDSEDGVSRVPGYPLEKASPWHYKSTSRFPHVLKSNSCYKSKRCPKISPLVKLTNCNLTGGCPPDGVPAILSDTLASIASIERTDRDSGLLVLSEGVKYGAFLLSPNTGYVRNGGGDVLPRCDPGTTCPGAPNYKEFDYWGGDGGSARSPTADRPVVKIMIVLTDGKFALGGTNRGRGGPDAFGGFEGNDYLRAFDRHVLGGLRPDFNCWIADNPRQMGEHVPVAAWDSLAYDEVPLAIRQRLFALGTEACNDHYSLGELASPDADCNVAARHDGPPISVRGPVRVCTFDYHRDGYLGDQTYTPFYPKVTPPGMEGLAIPDVMYDPSGDPNGDGCNKYGKCRMNFIKQYITNLGYLIKQKLDPAPGPDVLLYPNNLNRASPVLAPTFIYTVGLNPRSIACEPKRNACLSGKNPPTSKDIVIDLSSSPGDSKERHYCKGYQDSLPECCPRYFRCSDASDDPDFSDSLVEDLQAIEFELVAMIAGH